MATVTLSDSGKTLRDPAEVTRFLAGQGVTHQTWPVPSSLRDLQDKPSLTEADQARALAAYRERLDRERDQRGYIQADMVVLSPATPKLEELLAKFDRPHYHDDDEVRHIFAGEGIFGFEGQDGSRFTIAVGAGDYIIIPALACHWFTLTPSRSIKAIRLFKDTSGWAPHYKDAPAQATR